MVQSVEDCIRKALGMMSKVSNDPVVCSSPGKVPTSEGKLEMLLKILEQLDDKLGPEFQDEVIE